MKMTDKYPSYISEKRRPAPSPKDLVDADGQAAFGTFDEPLQAMSLLSCKKPCGKAMPDFMKKMRLTAWEAFEINMDEGSLVSAVYDMGAIGFSIFVWYEKAEKKVYKWFNLSLPNKTVVAPILIDTVTSYTCKKSSLTMENAFQNGLCHAYGFSKGKCGEFEYDMRATRLSPPSIVSIPFDVNKPLYSEKDFFKGEGYVKINGKTYVSNERTTCIVDDHKGYYPFKAHYDWLTTMGVNETNGEKQYFAFNLTRNQSTNQDEYNENLIWLQDVSCPLPPVFFEHPDKNVWTIKDEHGKVDVKFDIEGRFPLMVHAGLIDLSYWLTFGVISGYVEDIDGKRYVLDGMTGIGEDKTTRI